MSNELFTSMKNQLMPSDDCVNDLLAKIAALDAMEPSEQTDDQIGNNVVNFGFGNFDENSEIEDEYTVVEKKPQRSRKRVWSLSTVALAGAIALVSVFTMIGDEPADIQTSLNGVIDNQDVVQNGDNQQNPVGIDENGNAVVSNGDAGTDELQNPVLNNENQTDKEDGQDIDRNNSKDKNKNDKSNDSNANDNNLQQGITVGNNQGSLVTQTPAGNTNPSQSETQTPVQTQNPVQTQTPDNVTANPNQTENKIIPSEATTNELTWTREILSDSAVKQITVQGSNYVVDSSTTAVTTGSAIKKLSLSVPETKTTAADTVEASALEVANVSTDLAVAVDVDEYKGTLIYLNSSYEPETLGQLIKDAGIASGTSFTSVVYTGERIGYSSGKRINKDIKSIVVNTLFSIDAPKGNGYNSGTEKIVFVSNNNPTGTQITFGVSSSGFLRVVMSNGNVYTFDIGQAAANSFIDQLLDE